MNLLFLDIFGIGINLRYMNKDEYQTGFGVAITLIISGLLGIQIFLVGKEVINKTNPDVIFAEQYVASPARYNITRDTFNFAFGAQFPRNFSHFIDESIYTVSAIQVTMKKKYNESTGDYYQDWNNLPIQIHPCSSKDFGVKESIEYFNTLVGLENMYCLDYDSQELFMEGNFDQDSYGLIELQFKMCSGKPNCRDESEIKEILTNSFVAHYTKDQIVNPKNFDPFSIISRDMYWSTNPIYPKDAYLYYRNIYIQSDNGIVFEELDIQRKPALSYKDEQIRFEKAKETIYHRKYKKLDSILAEIGGIAKALVMIGFIICIPVNQLQLYNKLSNTLFKYSSPQIEKQKIDKSKPKPVGKTFVEIIEAQKEEINKKMEQQNLQNSYIYFQKDIQSNRQIQSKENQLTTPRQNYQATKNTFSSQQNLRVTINDKISKKELIQQNQSAFVKNKDLTETVKSKVLINTEPQELIKDCSNNIQSNAQILTSQNRFLANANEFNLFNIIKITKKMKQTPSQSMETALQTEKKIPASQIEMTPSTEKEIPVKIQEQKQQLNVCNQIADNNTPKQQQDQLNNFDEKYNQDDNSNSQNQNLQLGWSDYIKYYLWPFGADAKKKKQIDYSVEKIYQHLDIIYIVKKLLEFEKVKQILLNKDQIKLVQFFPKPLIDVDEIDQEKTQEKELVKSYMKTKQEQKQHKVNMLSNQNIDEQQRAKDAFQALQNIIKQEKLSEIDKKILEMLDDSILDNIQNNAEYLQQQINLEEVNSCVINEQRQFYQDNIYSFNVQDFNNIVSKDSQQRKILSIFNPNQEIQRNDSQESSFSKQILSDIESQEIQSLPAIEVKNFKQNQHDNINNP